MNHIIKLTHNTTILISFRPRIHQITTSLHTRCSPSSKVWQQLQIDISLWKLGFLAIKQLWTNFLNYTKHDALNDRDAEWYTIFSTVLPEGSAATSEKSPLTIE